MEVDTGCSIDPVIDLVAIGQYTDADRKQLLLLTLLLAPLVDSRTWHLFLLTAHSPGPLSC